jgi:DNA-binding transcriptional MerR regulator
MRSIRTLSSSLFLAGSLTLPQVCGLTNLPPHVLQNWIRRGFLPPPLKNQYSERQFYRIAIINFLKDSLRIELIVKLIEYVNAGGAAGSIDDTALYGYFIEALIIADNDMAKLDAAIKTALKSFREPYPGALKRLVIVIKIMIILYMSSQIKDSAELLLRNIGLLN